MLEVDINLLVSKDVEAVPSVQKLLVNNTERITGLIFV